MKKKYNIGTKIGITVAILIGLYVLMCVVGSFPVPRGDIYASTFHQRDDKTFEDKDFIYTMKEKPWSENYPFNKRKK